MPWIVTWIGVFSFYANELLMVIPSVEVGHLVKRNSAYFRCSNIHVTIIYVVHFSKMCFRAWLHDVKLQLFNKQKEGRVVEKHFNMWKKRIDLNSIATEMVRNKKARTDLQSVLIPWFVKSLRMNSRLPLRNDEKSSFPCILEFLEDALNFRKGP